MSEERILYRLDVTGEALAGQKMQRFQTRLSGINRVSREGVGRLGALAGGIGNLGTVVQPVNAELGQMGGVLGTAGSAATGLLTAVNPLVALLGGVAVGAVGLFATNLATAGDKMADLKSKTDDARRSLEDFLGQLQQEQQSAARQSRIALGIDPTEIEAQARLIESRTDALKKEQARLQERIRQLREDERVTERAVLEQEAAQIRSRNIATQIAKNEREIVELRERGVRAQKEMNDLLLEGESASSAPDAPRVAGARGAAADEFLSGASTTVGPTSRFAAEARPLGRSSAFAQGAQGTSIEALAAREGLAGLGAEIARDPLGTGRTGPGADLGDPRAGDRGAATLAALGKQNEAAETQARLVASLESKWKSMGDTAVDSLAAITTQIVTGNASAIPVILTMIGQQTLNEGISGLLRAGLMATNPATIAFAPAHAAAASAMIAFGASLIGAGSAAGGGGGAGASTAVANVTPVGGGGGGGGEGGGTLIINVHTLNPTAETGMAIVQSVEQARLQRGDTVLRTFQRGGR